MNRSIQAKAFTRGHNVFFRQGAYEPSLGVVGA
ncbi:MULTISPECIES: eCIS core domain-containing protein [unclassified Nostoc]